MPYITYSKYIFKFIVTQVTMSVFGLLISVASFVTYNMTVIIIGMLFAIGFFMFLLYDTFFMKGLDDSVKRTSEGQKKDKLEGMKIALLSYAPIIIIVVLYVLFFFIGLGDVNAIITIILSLIHGTYVGLWYILKDIHVYDPLIPILTLIPGIAACTLGYYLGLRELPIRKILGIPIKPPKTPKNK